MGECLKIYVRMMRCHEDENVDIPSQELEDGV